MDILLLLATKLGIPLGKLLLKNWLESDVAAAAGGGLAEIAAVGFKDSIDRREAERRFVGLGERICRQLQPLFERQIRAGKLDPEAVISALAKTLAGNIDVALLIAKELNPAELEAALRSAHPAATKDFSEPEVGLYDRALTESMRYLVAVASQLPTFQSQLASQLLQKLGRMSGDIDSILAATLQIRDTLSGRPSDDVAAAFEADYRQQIALNLDYFELFGADISTETRHKSLSVAYLSLNLSREDQGDKDAGGRTIAACEEILDRLHEGRGRVLIRGNAGSGKSTLFRWIMLEAARGATEGKPGRFRAHLEDEPDQLAEIEQLRADPRYWRRRVPFLIRLRDCPKGRLPKLDDLPGLVSESLGEPPKGWVKTVLDEGRGLVLFDGADEVAETARGAIKSKIEAFAANYPDNLYFVSGRPQAVQHDWLAGSGFGAAGIRELSKIDRGRLIDQWHAVVAAELKRAGKRANVDALAAKLKEELPESPQLARLATNPLLCAMICALHRDRSGHLPQSQIELCEALCHMLLHRREEESDLDAQIAPGYAELTYSDRRTLVKEIAHRMVWQERSAMECDQVDKLIAPMLSRLPHKIKASPREIRTALVERSGMLREPRPGRIEFIHNTFKEHLAVERFVHDGDWDHLAKHAHKTGWREVCVFAAAVDHEQFADRLLGRILCSESEVMGEGPDRDRLLLALRCQEVARIDKELRQRIQELAQGLFPPSDPEDAQALTAAGDAAVPFLTNAGDTEDSAIACIRTLRLIGTRKARAALNGFLSIRSDPVVEELAQAVNPLAIETLQELVTGGEPLPPSIASQVTDLTPLEGLTALQGLGLRDTQVSDLTPLEGLTALQGLDLSRTQVTDLTPLEGLTGLETLSLSRTQVPEEQINALRAALPRSQISR